MNRTIEKILGIIGFVMDAFFAAVGVLLLIIVNTGIGWLEGSINPVEFGAFAELITIFINLLWIPIISCVISFILGLVGVLNLKRNPRVAGGFFIAATVISSWLLFTGIAFQSVLYAVAAIMCFVRKPERNAA
ncbi:MULTISPECIES: DUF4064 domain-containing protein [Virgibacillus]|uniref:DUF4064 domain-containing protein n=2 Tax=Virgibacillus TaxID=84406 RepID=A0A024Q9P8_9BACI|nr:MULTISPECIES: DUF4064 domain-containing protein [Virgibacillus]EQB37804.1 hypothetical protein M948_04375 [Virgibacillus sp. CM-4]GGJ58109.1 membrane protein [Virgibacillus kapii]CDQ38671.1 hypothetical protein BN990_00943 [Virgibacillus massiliensis]